MKDGIVKILLVSDKKEDYNKIHPLLEKLEKRVELDFISNLNNLTAFINGSGYDVCLIDYSWMKEYQKDILNNFLSEIRGKQIVFLIDNSEISKKIEEAGISSYLIKNELNPALFNYIIRNAKKNSDIFQKTYHTENELERFFHVSLDMLSIINFNGYFKRINPAFEKILGHSQEELLSKPVIEFIHPEERVSTLTELDALKNGIPSRYFENRFICKDRTHKWFAWVINPVVEEKAMYAVAHDITSYKNMEEELKTYTAKLEQSNRELQDFANVASHDLQEPLRKVRAFGSRLEAKYGHLLDEQARDYLDRMQKASERMQNLINDLLTFSRVNIKAQPFLQINLEKVIKDVLFDLEINIENKSAVIKVDTLPVIEADKLQMNQLFLNLIGNALKFSQPGNKPVITIYSKPLNIREITPDNKLLIKKLYQIFVQDNGIGFEQKYTDRIFNIFQRLHNRSEYEGTGIGLAICRKIAEHHKGNITAKSKPGLGTTFIVTLPLKQSNE